MPFAGYLNKECTPCDEYTPCPCPNHRGACDLVTHAVYCILEDAPHQQGCPAAGFNEAPGETDLCTCVPPLAAQLAPYRPDGPGGDAPSAEWETTRANLLGNAVP